jgi:hypothetical protein
MGRRAKNKTYGPVPSAVLHFRPVHFDIGKGEVACHATHPGKGDLKKSTHPEMVDCLRCRNTYDFRAVAPHGPDGEIAPAPDQPASIARWTDLFKGGIWEGVFCDD